MSISFPAVLLLTHKRGAGIAVLQSTIPTAQIAELLGNEIHNAQILNNFEFITYHDTFLLRVIGKTAENLSAAFRYALQASNIPLEKISTILVGIGPGSFTGLRLGCAFANGIKLGIPHLNLLPVTTSGAHGDALVDFADIATALTTALQEKRSFVSALLPEYGQEPGPVLKLKGKL